MTSCSIAEFPCESRESRMRDTNSQERGEGKALTSRWNALSSSGRESIYGDSSAPKERRPQNDKGREDHTPIRR
jgi:hypothetical protein